MNLKTSSAINSRFTQAFDCIIPLHNNMTNESVYSRLEEEARWLIDNKVNITAGYMALGTLATFQGDVEKTHLYYRQAIASAPLNSNIYVNYGTHLLKLGYLSEVVDIYSRAYDKFNNNVNIIRNFIKFAIITGKYELADILFNQWHKLIAPNEKAATEAIITFAQKNTLDEEAIQQYITIATDILHQLKNPLKMIFDIKPQLLFDQDVEWIENNVYITNVSMDELVDMSFKLTDTLAEVNLPAEITDKFLVSYHSWIPR
jgi:tetratricopeptide (TPR) repeat protein